MSEILYDSAELSERLSYRYPMLLLDRVLLKPQDELYIGLKNLSFNEPVFQGHFPGHPIMPGVLQVEAMQQVAELAVQDRLDPEREGDIYVKSLSKVKFRRPANPGDRLMIELKVEEIKNGEALVSASNHIAAGVSCQAKMVLAVRQRIKPEYLPREFSEIDKTGDIALDVEGIKAIIPHRYPFLLVDYVVSFAGINVLAVKNVTGNDALLRGYSPDCMVFPGVVQSEIIAQAGAVLMLSRPENKGKIAYFMSIDESECLHPVFPGDQLRIDVELPEGRSRFGRGNGSLSVDGREVARTVMTFAVVET